MRPAGLRMPMGGLLSRKRVLDVHNGSEHRARATASHLEDAPRELRT